MEREYKKLKQQIETVTPLETTINEAKRIENIHKLLKNKGENYKFSDAEKELISKLT